MHKIKQAIISVAGLATRIYPMNKVTKKALLPICDSDGRIKPVIIKLLEELDESGIEKINLIIDSEDKAVYDRLFNEAKENVLRKLSDEDKIYDKRLNRIGKKVTYIVQDKKLGFVHAVYLSRPNLNDEPVILLLDDTIYKSSENSSAVEQLLSYYDEVETTIIALTKLEVKELKDYGTVQGKWENNEKTKLHLDKIVEKAKY